MVTSTLKRTKNQRITEDQRISNPTLKRLYTVKEGAEYLGRSEWSMRELIWAGKIPVVKDEWGRKIFLDILDLQDFVDHNKLTYQ